MAFFLHACGILSDLSHDEAKILNASECVSFFLTSQMKGRLYGPHNPDCRLVQQTRIDFRPDASTDFSSDSTGFSLSVLSKMTNRALFRTTKLDLHEAISKEESKSLIPPEYKIFSFSTFSLTASLTTFFRYVQNGVCRELRSFAKGNVH